MNNKKIIDQKPSDKIFEKVAKLDSEDPAKQVLDYILLRELGKDSLINLIKNIVSNEYEIITYKHLPFSVDIEICSKGVKYPKEKINKEGIIVILNKKE